MKKYNFTEEQKEEYDFICNEQLDYVTERMFLKCYIIKLTI